MRIPGNVTHTCVELEISAAAYDEIAAKLKEADYHHVFMDNGSIDMSGIAVTRGIDVSALKATLITGTPIADGQLREIFAIEANENSQRASASAGSADRVSPTQREGAVPSPQGTADVETLATAAKEGLMRAADIQDVPLGRSSTAEQGPKPEPWQQRVIEEKRELDDRLDKLRAFRKTEAFKLLAIPDQALLNRQQFTMQRYSWVLEQRISRFGPSRVEVADQFTPEEIAEHLRSNPAPAEFNRIPRGQATTQLNPLWLIVSAADELESILSKLVTSGETTISSTGIGAAALVERLNTLCTALKAVRQP